MIGWVRLYRSLAHHPLWLSESFTDGQAWVDLLMLAHHRDGAVKIRGIRLSVGRGQIAMSEVSLAERWKWSRGKVRRFLKYLVQEKMIQMEQQNNCITTLITITNYDLHQGGDTADGTLNSTAGDTANEQQTGIKTPQLSVSTKKKTPKNVKNDKKPSSPESLRLSGVLADLILKNNPTHSKLSNGGKESTVNRWAVDIDKLIRIDRQQPEEVEKVIRWCQSDSFWQSNILSGANLRKQWDTLKVKTKSDKDHGTLSTTFKTKAEVEAII